MPRECSEKLLFGLGIAIHEQYPASDIKPRTEEVAASHIVCM